MSSARDEHEGIPSPRLDVISEAIGVLVLVYRTTPNTALERLREVAERHAVGLAVLAEAVIAVASGVAPSDPRFVQLIDTEWGDLLL